MNEDCFAALEFPALLDLVAGYAATPMGAEAIRSLRPAATLEAAAAAFDPVDELMAALARGDSPPFEGLTETRPLWERLESQSAYLEPEEWLRVQRFLHAGRAMSRFFAGRARECPACAALAAAIDPLDELGGAIRAVIDDDGLVRDDASPELYRLRQALRRVRDRMRRQCDGLLRDLSAGGALQGEYWTVRKGRGVIPVRANFKGRVPGLVHDASQSGETLFIEPFAIVELSNELIDLEGREIEEIRRVLIALGDRARIDLAELRRNADALVAIDCAFGRARYGQRNGCLAPAFAADDGFAIRRARHPLLIAAGGVAPVPVDLEFLPGQRSLILTGPNTGGKTTTLKTLGLLCLMAQSGIPVPCDAKSAFPVFASIHADIGDEQSLAEGLSTFSGHLRSIQRVLQSAGRGALVLFDELGTATDPVQGGALASVVLERLAEAGATTLATTHLPQLKLWAHEYPTARNAATRFDEIEGRPAFQIVYDQPGASEAFRVAQALGFPRDILEEAERRAPKGEMALNELIAALEEQDRRLKRDLAQAALERARLESERKELDALLAEAREANRRHRQTAAAERQRLIAEARTQIERRVANLGSRHDLEALRADLREEESKAAREAEQLQAAAPEALTFDSLAPGQTVFVRPLNELGRIKRLRKKARKAVVETRGTEIEMAAHQLARAPEGSQAPARPPRSLRPSIVRADSRPPSRELNLHGQRVEAALELLDKFLDRALVDGQDSVSILVGHGALRAAVEEELKRRKHVASFRRGGDGEGGEAVLLARLG
ncbi:MAG: Endonuclease MutS2 [candidate division BRC1 bacterium ADurb.BinA364]|nr:MAG: Endonuclease MutS2 [candidate division BRC1 bacterium ADurb.BinA364]